MMSLRDLHPLKANSPISMTEEGIDIFDNDEHPAKLPLLIDFNEVGMFTLVKDEHLKKTYSSSVSNELLSSNVISVNDVQFLNARLIIYFIEEGIVILVKDEHPLKAESPIEVTEEGIMICKFLQF